MLGPHLYHLVPRSPKIQTDPKRFEQISEDSKRFQKISKNQKDPKRFQKKKSQKIPKDTKRSQKIPKDLKRFQEISKDTPKDPQKYQKISKAKFQEHWNSTIPSEWRPQLRRPGEIIREQVDEGELEIQGGIYDLETGSVHFLGRSPFHAEVLKSESSPSDSSWTFEKVAGSWLFPNPSVAFNILILIFTGPQRPPYF